MNKINHEEVLKKSLEYFDGDELCATTWMKKYALRDSKDNLYESDPNDMHIRLAKEFARIENKYPNPVSFEEIFKLLQGFRYLVPQGSPMAGIGNKFNLTSLSNCFVIDNPYDSYGSIFRTDEEQVQLMKRRGGVGHDISNLRPSGSLANNSILHSVAGTTLYMERYSNSTREVSQGDRRGALMLSIHINHPDVEAFIDKKLDTTKVTGANVSVKVTDEFMEAVVKDTNFIQVFPIDLKIRYHTAFMESLSSGDIKLDKLYSLEDGDPENKGCYAKVINARKLWKKIIHNAWKSAEPGILFWDTVKKESLGSCYGKDWKETSTNPSLRGDTLILTEKGVFPIKEVAEKFPDVRLLNCEGNWIDSFTRKTGEKKQLYKLTFTNGNEVFCTPEHKWPILNYKGDLINQNGIVEKKTPSEMKKGDKLYFPLNTSPINVDYSLTREEGFLLGWWYGDGWETFSCYHNQKQIGFQFGDEDVENGIGKKILDCVNEFLPDNRKCHLRQDRDTRSQTFNTYNTSFIDYLETLGQEKKENGLPQTIWKSNQQFIAGFIDGLFSADGSIYISKNNRKNAILTLTSSRKKLLTDVRKLLGFYGIAACINHQQQKLKGREKVYDCWHLTISTSWIQRFAKCFQLSHTRKQSLIDQVSLFDNTQNYRLGVKKIELTDEYDDVYDATVNDWSHTFFTEVGLTGNCGEIPLNPYDSCRLLAINLYSYVQYPFTPNARFDFELFKDHVEKAQRLMDDLVDLEIEKIEAIIKKVMDDTEPDDIKSVELNLWHKILDRAKVGRRTGLGITAEGDMLAALGYKYGEESAINFSKKVHEIMAVHSYISSIILAKERGSFPIWNYRSEIENPFINRILESEYFPVVMQGVYQTYGRRNISNLTIAPTGTTSFMTRTSSGIEPAIFIDYTRRRKVNGDNENYSFVDEVGDKWQEFRVFHHKFIDWYNLNWYKIDPKWFDLDYKPDLYECSKEDLQKIIQYSPYYKSTANEIDWVQKVKMQGEIQKWVDHSISVTVNLPEDVTEDVVENVYFNAWEYGCKGVTVYRENSRSGVIVQSKENADIQYVDQIERPKVLQCDIYRKTALKQDWIIIVGLLNNKPYEIFAIKALPNYDFPITIKKGIVTKIKSKVYRLDVIHSGKKYTIPNIVELIDNGDGRNTRRFSLMLRSGVNPVHIVDDIDEYDHITSFDKVVARVLKTYINGEKSRLKCPSCQSVLTIIEGCNKCLNCGYSTC